MKSVRNCATAWCIAALAGFAMCQLLSGCFSAMQASGEAWSGDAGKKAHRDAMAADIVTLPIQAPLIAGAGVLAVLGKATDKLNEKDRAKYDQLKAQVRADPGIVLRERWDISRDQKRRTTIWASLSDPQTPYTADQLEKIYATAPSLRWAVFEHPACRPDFLAAHFSEAKAIYSKNSSLLGTFVSNPSTPTELVEEIAESGSTYWVAREKAKMALSRRLPDRDRDELPDSWEIREGTDPNVRDANKDTDHDGMDNWHEYLRGLHPINPDSDGDGLPDGFEEQNFLNPLDPLRETDGLPVPSNLHLFKTTDGRWLLRWTANDQNHLEASYLVYQDGRVILYSRTSYAPCFYDKQAPHDVEFVYQVRTMKNGEGSRLSGGLHVRINATGGWHEIPANGTKSSPGN